MNVTCPNCEIENAYHDGVAYICPNCDYSWTERLSTKKTTIFDSDKYDFEYLIKLDKPFFRLNPGKIYSCKVSHKEGIEDTFIIPLAFDVNRNRQFILTDAKRLFKLNSGHVKKIMKMDFNYIWNDGIMDYPFDYNAMTIICTTQSDQSLLDGSGMIYFNFQETDLL
jgi:hypothetical protein